MTIILDAELESGLPSHARLSAAIADAPRLDREILIVSGSLPTARVDDLACGFYPENTVGFVEHLEESGVPVEYLDPQLRRRVDDPDGTTANRQAVQQTELFSGGDLVVLLPVLLFAREVLAAGLGELFAIQLEDWLNRHRQRSRAVFRIELVKAKGGNKFQVLKAEGPPEDVVQLVREWLGHDQ
jgi:hypothetical protein